jgi:hypothetical protein
VKAGAGGNLTSLALGERIQINLFGLRLAGRPAGDSPTEGTVVGLAPGVITVRLQLDDGGHSEVTVSPGRIER